MRPAIVFPPFRLDPANEQLSREGEPLTLRPKAFAVLRHLAERPGRLVTKEEILAAVWPDTFVSDTVLKVCVNELRRVLHDEARAPAVIQTVHRRGYRFIARLESGEPDAATGEPDGARAPAAAGGLVASAALVGREREMDELRRAYAAAQAGRRQVVFVSGEAGIGKTALLDAFLAEIARSGASRLGRGQCVAQYGEGEAFLPWLEALGRLCRDADGGDVVRLVRSHAPDWLLQLPGLLDAAARAELKRDAGTSAPDRMLRLAVDLLDELAAERPLVLVLEDLHWSDPSTVDLVARVAERREPARLLLLCTYRPAEAIARGHPLRAVQLELSMRGRCRDLLLGFLDEAATAAYLRTRFPVGDMPPGLAAWLHRRTDGSPLFLGSVVAELVAQGFARTADGRTVFTEGFERIGIPADLRQMIEQQIDRLAPDDRRLLEAAAVAGAEFAAAAVAAALEAPPLEVEERFEDWTRRGALVRAEGGVTWPDGTVSARLAFVHSLYREVQYQRIPPARRALLHRRIGERLEAAWGAGSRDAPAELAIHFEECGDAARAVTYLRVAAERARRRGAHREVVASLGHAIDLLERRPPSPERSREVLALHLASGPSRMAASLSDEGVRSDFTAALALAEELGDRPSQFLARAGLWAFHFSRAELRQAQGLADDLTELAGRLALDPFHFAAHTLAGVGRFLAGDLATAHARLEAARATGIELPATVRPGLNGLCLGFLSATLALLGRPDEARRCDVKARRRAAERSDVYDRVSALLLSAQLHSFLRDVPETSASIEHAATLAEDHDLAQMRAITRIGRGWCRAHATGGAGVEEIEAGIRELEALGLERSGPWYLSLAADLYLRDGRIDDARSTLARAQATVQATGERFYAAELERLQGECAGALAREARSRGQARRKAEQIAEAERCFERALAIAREQGSRWWELRAAASLARLHAEAGRTSAARALLAPVCAGFTEGADTPDLRDARALLERL